jgi:hypothetical protein
LGPDTICVRIASRLSLPEVLDVNLLGLLDPDLLVHGLLLGLLAVYRDVVTVVLP